MAGMKEPGFRVYLDERVQSPMRAAFRFLEFRTLRDGVFRFDAFISTVAKGGFLLYPAKLTGGEKFRIGCIDCAFEELVRAVADELGTPYASKGPAGRTESGNQTGDG